MRGHESNQVRQQIKPSVEENRVVETLAASFSGLVLFAVRFCTDFITQ